MPRVLKALQGVQVLTIELPNSCTMGSNRDESKRGMPLPQPPSIKAPHHGFLPSSKFWTHLLICCLSQKQMQSRTGLGGRLLLCAITNTSH